jgi:hypothetical protein
MLALQLLQWTNTSTRTSSVVKILSGIHLVLFPIWAGVFLLVNREKLNKKEIKDKFESLYLNLRKESKA